MAGATDLFFSVVIMFLAAVGFLYGLLSILEKIADMLHDRKEKKASEPELAEVEKPDVPDKGRC